MDDEAIGALHAKGGLRITLARQLACLLGDSKMYCWISLLQKYNQPDVDSYMVNYIVV